jgi:hypothetical protein
MKESKTELEQNIDEIIESSRKISNIFTLETARLIKAALVNNKHSEKPVSELEVLQKMAKGVIADVQSRFPTAQKSTIVKIFKSLL